MFGLGAMDLPVIDLHHGPVRHPHCCLSLSSTLLSLLSKIAQEGSAGTTETRVILSVGSGTGLLEALLTQHAGQQHHDTKQMTLIVEGVEVPQPGTDATPNLYLPEQHFTTVRRSWEISPRLGDTDVVAVMFVYPRQPALVSQYVRAVLEGGGETERAVIWLGPVTDWDEFGKCFEGSGRVEVGRGGDEGVGLVESEMMVVWWR
jgi:hypothetical protein